MLEVFPELDNEVMDSICSISIYLFGVKQLNGNSVCVFVLPHLCVSQMNVVG